MTCATCRLRPVRLSGRSAVCIVCAYTKRVANAVASKIERDFKHAQLRRWRERRAA